MTVRLTSPSGFHAPQGLGQHLLRNPLDHAFELAVATRAVEERVDDQAGPLVRDPVQRLA